MQLQLVRAVDHLEATFTTGIHQIAGDFRLAIDHHLLAGQLFDIDADQPFAIGQVEAIMRQPLGLHPAIEPKPLHQADGDLFEHTSANPAKHVIRLLSFEYHAFDTFGAQQMAQKQARRPSTDDANLCLHDQLPNRP